MLGRLKKTVSSVIGNPVCRDYEFTIQTGTCGPGGLWKIYDGRKKSTGQVLFIVCLVWICHTYINVDCRVCTRLAQVAR